MQLNLPTAMKTGGFFYSPWIIQPVAELATVWHQPVAELATVWHQPVAELATVWHQPVAELATFWHRSVPVPRVRQNDGWSVSQCLSALIDAVSSVR
jgi:hypothetical protein